MASPRGIRSPSLQLRRLLPPLRFSLAGSRPAAPRVLILLLPFVLNDDCNHMNDLKFAFRQLRKSPGFTVAVVVTLGVGIGINVAMYSIIHAVLLSELPFPEADRLVAISETWADGISPMSYPDYLDWKAAQHSFDEIAVSRRDDFNLTGNGEPERFSGLFVTASYFRVLKIPPKLGRTFFDEEDSVAGVNPIVLSEHVWRSRFAADPA